MAHNFQRTHKITHNSIIELSRNSAIKNAEHIELFFLRHEDVLIATAKAIEYSISNKNTGVEEIHTLLKAISTEYDSQIYSKYANTKFTGIYAAVNGELVHGLKTPQDLPKGYDPTKRQWYKEGIQGHGNIVFGEPYKDIYSPNLVLTATKLLNDGTTVLGMDITLEDLQFASGDLDISIFSDGKEHIYGHGFILTNNGVVVAHRDKSEQGACYNDPANPMYNVFQQIKKCIKKESTYFEIKYEGKTYAIFPHILTNGWYVVTLTDLEDISSTISEFSIFIASGTIFSILLASIYCILITLAQIKSEKLAFNLSNALVLAKKDGLTGHKNRTAYDIYVKTLSENMNTKKDKSFALIMMDLNDLKYVNDHYGHVAGDQYIRNSCHLVRSIVSSEIYRIGGDEFALFLTDDLFEQHTNIFNDLKHSVDEGNALLIPNVDKPSIAFGIATHIKDAQDEIESIIRLADTQMYTNKAEIKQARLKSTKKHKKSKK